MTSLSGANLKKASVAARHSNTLHMDGEGRADWDLAACRELLTSLPSNDLRDRLQRSPWQLHGGHVPDHMNWLKEAATAFSVTLRTKGIRKPKAKLVDEVLQAIGAARAPRAGVKTVEDDARRSSRLAELRSRHAVRTAQHLVPKKTRSNPTRRKQNPKDVHWSKKQRWIPCCIFL